MVTIKCLLRANNSIFYYPQAIHRFSNYEKNKFSKILSEEKYDVVFMRFASPSKLTGIIEEVLPEARIVIDIDMLLSRLTKLSWKRNPCLKNCYYLIENLKLNFFEKKLYNKPYLFFFTNYIEKDMVLQEFVKKNSKGRFRISPNVMKKTDFSLPDKRDNYIIFFGTLSSSANEDAFVFLANKIYPFIRDKLKENGITINIVGRNKTAIYDKLIENNKLENIKLVGEVDNINKEISKALFTILPIRIASGTRTRILESANLKVPIISTNIGAEGFRFSEDEIIIRDNAEDFANAMIKLIANPQKAIEYGKKIEKKSKELYLDSVVSKKLTEEIIEYINSKF